ncbi:MAG TPA: hypothetical protein VHD39_03925 [Acidimicrobiales bacterium]|nr:hypothetical protein [Acidimicrobiales bacterium]
MKFSARQILASAAGAVIAAVIASTFGVKGTIVGVAIGSAAATLGTAFVAQSLERGHEAVRQVVERVPDSSASTLLRRLGSTDSSGTATATVVDPVAPTEAVEGVERVGTGSGSRDDTVQMDRSPGPAERTQRLEVSAVAGAPPTERLVASSTAAAPTGLPRWSWKTIAAMAAIVFVLALLFITAVELISGKPLSDIFGGAGSGTSVNNLFNNQSPAASTTTTTTQPTSSTTSSTTAPTSTSTTAPTGQSTTTTSAPPGGTTTTTVVGGAGTSGSASSTTTSTSVPG